VSQATAVRGVKLWSRFASYRMERRIAAPLWIGLAGWPSALVSRKSYLPDFRQFPQLDISSLHLLSRQAIAPGIAIVSAGSAIPTEQLGALAHIEACPV
jgi:hypothetical protein